MTGLLLAATIVATFTNDCAVLSLDSDARIASIRELASGRELVQKPRPIANVEMPDGKVLYSAKLRSDGKGRFIADIVKGKDMSGKMEFSVAGYPWGWTFTLDGFSVPDAKRIFLWRVKPAPSRYVGNFANVSSDDSSFVALRPFTPAMETRIGDVMSAVANREHGFCGHVAAIAAGPRSKAVECLRGMTIAAGAPRSSCGGAWSLGAVANRDSYLFASKPEAAHVDDWIAAARRGGLPIVHFYSWFETRGHYYPHPKRIPGGLDGLKRMVDAIHAAGLKAGMHTFTGRIGVEDAFIRPVCDSNLISFCSYTLAEPIPAGKIGELRVVERPDENHDLCASTMGRGNFLRIGGEIVQYSGIRREQPYAFTGIARGACGTARTAHGAGEQVYYLRARFQGFYPVIGSPLAEAVADNIARAWNVCGFDQIYFDGSEAHGTIHDVDSMRCLIASKLSESEDRPILDEASCTYPGSWWFHSRQGAFDHPNWGDKRFHDLHVERTLETSRKANFLEPQLGWWSFRNDARRMRREFLDEAEYFAAKSAAANAAISILSVNANVNRMESHTLRCLTVVGWHEYPKRAQAFAPAALDWLGRTGFETRLRQDADGTWRLQSVTCMTHRVFGPAAADWREQVDNPCAAALRVEALYSVQREAEGERLLTAADMPKMERSFAKGVEMELSSGVDPNHGDTMRLSARNVSQKDRRGAYTVAKRTFAYPWLNISGKAAIGAWVKGDGSGALLCFQVCSPDMHNGAMSDHYVRLDFKGWRYVELLFRERDAAGIADYAWPHRKRFYKAYREVLRENAIDRVSIMVNDVPVGGRVDVEVADVRAMPIATNVLRNAAVAIGDARFAVPFDLKSGEYAELEDGAWIRYSERGEPLSRVPAAARPELAAGANDLSFSADAADTLTPRAEVTVFGLGRKVEAFAPLSDDMRRMLSYEAEMPVEYAPARGFRDLPPVAIRPGERAGIGFTCHGPLPQFVMTLGDKRFDVPAVAAGATFVLKPGEAGIFEGTVPVSVSFRKGDAVDTRFEFVKDYRIKK